MYGVFLKIKILIYLAQQEKEHLIVSFHKYYDGNITKRLQQPKRVLGLSKKNRIQQRANLYDGRKI